MVGSQVSKCSGFAIDQDHEGHPGSLATDFAKNGNLTGWLDRNPPDVVIMLVGTNDVLIGKKPVDEVLHAYDVLLEEMRAKNENMQIVFSNLLPLDPARFSATGVAGIKTLNTAIASYAPSKSTTKSPVYFVDNYDGFDAVKDTDDGEHPNLATGVEKMATKFLDVTKTAIRAAETLKKKRSKSRFARRA
ncbi:acetylxylan esterase [Pyrenophora seminiperda CCB06]|uniref:Acetylxylan esterase n=1 Tax=Pyrenophora seminiperda CCB06 TaxID=1302712 RepID=A0A3M7MDG8_9PLEO|nr:acetylxylan esterase [Pyrenophora seminiperda CCB06]